MPKTQPNVKKNAIMSFAGIKFPINIPADNVIVETGVNRAIYKSPLQDGVFIDHMSRNGIKISATAYFNNTIFDGLYPDVFQKILWMSQTGAVEDVIHPSFTDSFKGMITINNHTLSSKNIYGVEASITIDEVIGPNTNNSQDKSWDIMPDWDSNQTVVKQYLRSKSVTPKTVNLISKIEGAFKSVTNAVLQGERYKNKYINKVKSITGNIDELIRTIERQPLDGGAINLIEYYKTLGYRYEVQARRSTIPRYKNTVKELGIKQTNSIILNKDTLTSRFLAVYKLSKDDFSKLNPSYSNYFMLKQGTTLYYYS